MTCSQLKKSTGKSSKCSDQLHISVKCEYPEYDQDGNVITHGRGLDFEVMQPGKDWEPAGQVMYPSECFHWPIPESGEDGDYAIRARGMRNAVVSSADGISRCVRYGEWSEPNTCTVAASPPQKPSKPLVFVNCPNSPPPANG